MKVLSLFDGMSCGRIALDQLGIPVEKYYASEIDKYAIQVSQANYPDIIQIGDVTKVNPKDYMDVDLILVNSWRLKIHKVNYFLISFAYLKQ